MTDDEWWDEFEAERFDEIHEVADQPDELIWTQFEDAGVIEYHPGRHEGGGGYYVGIKPWGPEHADLVITVDDDDLRALGGYR